MLHRSWPTGDETFYLVQALNIVGADKWKSLQEYGAEDAHALFDYDHDRECYWLRDLSTKGGVRINGIPISKIEPVRLKNGDRISFARSPEYTFLATSTPSSERKKLTEVYALKSPHRAHLSRRQHSYDEAVENGDVAYGNLAVDSAPSVNGASNASSTFNTLPKLSRGRSPASRRALSQLPIATLIDGRRIENGVVSEDSDVMIMKPVHISPTTLTYRQRHFLRHASTDTNPRVSPSRTVMENRRRIITNAWSDNRDIKYIASSPSSTGSYVDGNHQHQHSSRKISNGNGSAFQRTNQAHTIRQLQNRVLQLEEALRLSHADGILVINGIGGGDSGISSANSAKDNDKANEQNGDLGRQISDGGDADQHHDEKSDSLGESTEMREFQRLKSALASSERRRIRLENLLQSKDPDYQSALGANDGFYEEQATGTSIELSSPQIIPPSPHTVDPDHDNATGEDYLNGSFSSCEHCARPHPHSHPQQISDNNNHPIGETTLTAPTLKDSASTCDWRDFVKDYQAPLVVSGSHSPVHVQAPEVASENTGVDDKLEESDKEVQMSLRVIHGAEAAPCKGDAEGVVDSEMKEDIHKDSLKEKDQLDALLLIQSLFADEIGTWPDKVLSDPLFDFAQLTTKSVEEKKELYKMKLHQLMASKLAENTEEDYLDTLCIWAVQVSAPILISTDKLMPKVVDLLKRRTSDRDAQKTLESWLKDFQLQLQNDSNCVKPEKLQEAAELLELYGGDYWQLTLLVNLLRLISGKISGHEKSKPEINNGHVNTDINQQDFNKLISDVADLLDEKEQLRQVNSNLQNDLITKHDEYVRLRNQFDTMETDNYLLQNDNRNLTAARAELQKRIVELEEHVNQRNAQGSPNDLPVIQILKVSNTAYRQRVTDQAEEIEQLKQQLQELEHPAAIQVEEITELAHAQPLSAEGHVHEMETNENQPEIQEPVEETEHSHDQIPEVAIDCVTESAREELEHLKQKIAELEQANGEMDAEVMEKVSHQEQAQIEEQEKSRRGEDLEELENQKREAEMAMDSLNEKQSDRDQLSARLENHSTEHEHENILLEANSESQRQNHNEPCNGVQSDQTPQDSSTDASPQSTESHPVHSTDEVRDDMFWTLSERLASLLHLESIPDQISVTPVETAPVEPLVSPNRPHKDPIRAALDITDKVQELLDRVRRQNEELNTYRGIHSAAFEDAPRSGEVTIVSHNPPPYLAPMLANGHLPISKENIDQMSSRRSSDQDIKPCRRSRSGSLRFRRHRSPSPQSLTGHSSSSHQARECHACDVLRARRKQQEYMHMARIQAQALANRQLDTYPLKIVTFKLPSNEDFDHENH